MSDQPTPALEVELTDAQATQLGAMVDRYAEARELGSLFAAAGHELYLVGGTVRDTLLAGDASTETIDLDFATSARPDDTEKILDAWADAVWLAGKRFGTIGAQKHGRTIEITTFRADTYQRGSRHPDVVFGDSIEADLRRRDFTVNALAVRVPDFRFVDLFGGLQDLRAGVLRTPIDPRESFADDPLRMVRLARFSARLDATPEKNTLQAATDMADELTNISTERIYEEFKKLVCADHFGRGLDVLIATGLARHVAPELIDLADCRDPQHRHKDVWEHTIAVIENSIELETDGPDWIVRAACLFHDIGKPSTKRMFKDGSVTFRHHEVVGGRMTKKRLQELKASNDEINQIAELVTLSGRFHTYGQGWTDAAVRRFVRDAGPILEPLLRLTRSDITTKSERREAAIKRKIDELEERIAVLREQEELDSMRPPIDGRQIMDHLGISPGPEVGEAWNFLLELRIEEGPMDTEAAHAALDKWWSARAKATPADDATQTRD